MSRLEQQQLEEQEAAVARLEQGLSASDITELARQHTHDREVGTLLHAQRDRESQTEERRTTHISSLCSFLFVAVLLWLRVLAQHTHTHTKDPAEQLECGDQIPEEVTEARIPRHCH